eukprot:16441678-Heterocapsa_arctica.AAC.1
MVTCSDCGLSITFHNLKSTHKRYCKALKIEKAQDESASASVVAAPIQQAPPPPGLLQRTKTTTADVED